MKTLMAVFLLFAMAVPVLAFACSGIVGQRTEKGRGITMRSLMRLALLNVFIGSMLIGCATHKEWVPYGGSKSDGVVKLAFDRATFEKPVIPEGQAVQVATQRCRAWGYTGAEPFGGVFERCVRWNPHGCERYLVYTEFQCTGK